jgi:hypothetical protein
VRSPRQRSTGRLDGVDRIGLALATSSLAVVAVDFDHLDPRPGEEPGQACPIGPGPFHADRPDPPKPGEPREQCHIAVGGGIEGLGAEQSAHFVKSGSHVHLASLSVRLT